MTGELRTHETSLSLLQAPPAEADAGAEAALKVRVACPCGCDLRGAAVRIVSPEGPLREFELAEFDGAANETAGFFIRMPAAPGSYAWAVLFLPREGEGILHGESSAQFSFSVRPHAASMAIWDVPSPVASGAAFTVKAGVKCSAGCRLTGARIEVCDGAGAKQARATLGEEPWPGTAGLYWAEIALEAPAAEGVSSWRVRFPEQAAALPHEESSSGFLFRIVGPPEHTVTVAVIDKDLGTPVEEAEVFLNPYRVCTDRHGLAAFHVAGGTYDLDVLTDGYETFQAEVEVTGDVTVRAELRRRAKALWE